MPDRAQGARRQVQGDQRLERIRITSGLPAVVLERLQHRGRHYYDSIEVCLDKPQDDSAVQARLDALEDADLEQKLYEKECMPGVWMPIADGGRLEDARALVAQRLLQAVSTGDAGVNAHVAQARLEQADAAAAAGQYQRACRSLVDALHALTTP